MKTYAALALLLGLNWGIWAQQSPSPIPFASTLTSRAYSLNRAIGDGENKELSVVAGILLKLIEQEFNNGDTAVNIARVKGTYIPGSGVLFTITQRNPFYRHPLLFQGQGSAWEAYGLTTPGRLNNFSVMELIQTSKNKTRAGERPQNIPSRSDSSPANKTKNTNNNSPYILTLPDGMARMVEDTIEVLRGSDVVIYTPDGALTFNNQAQHKMAKIQDSIFSAKISRMKKVIAKFLAEYTILLNQTKPEEKIWVNWMLKDDHWGFNQNKMDCELSGRILKQDMLDLRAEKIDPTTFAEQIQYSITRCAEQITYPEVEVFSAILERLYAQDISHNLTLLGGVQSEVIGGFGYVFKMVFSSSPIRELAIIRPRNETHSTNPQPNETVPKKELEQAFKKEFPQQLLEYSRILKGLKTGEILKVDVYIDEFGRMRMDWDKPDEGATQLSYTLTESLIRDYDKGKLKLEEALKLVLVEEK